uniref:multiple RNA-binding domain-containing protein 1-like isoform X2 n=1 Tax=Erigeron canadensis TaxID=72917 RepID=UPI001CB95847|nr:multiple RNA-binding domain-containing protein 1-like isoform X2 [Erigeron canadensis]
MKSPGEKNGLESKKREQGESESKVKKKVRIVKKIVKKKVIKKVPKRLLVVKDNDNLDNNVVSPNDNISDLVVDNEVVVNEKGNLVAENVKEGEASGSEKGGFCKDNVSMEIENVKEVEVSGREKSVCLVENDDSLTGFENFGSFKGNDNIVMETEKLNVADKKEVEVSDRENSVCLVENDDSLMGLEKVASFKGNDDVVMEVEKFDVGKKEVEDRKEVEVIDREKVSVGLVESDDSCRDESEVSGFVSSSMLVDRDRIELEDGVNTMDVVEHEGEEDEESYQTDVGVSESVKVEENVKEILVNSETDGMKSREAVNETREWSEEMVVSWWRMKQRTKIFIHGLCNETKEEDIRRVFEELGEVVEVKIITNFRSGKSRGFGFVRFASGELANLALTKFSNVEICGSMCHTAVVEGKDTILLSNIDNEWNDQNVLALLQEIGITKINEVTVVPDSENTELNRGFAFVEFETKRDAQMAYLTLQNKNVFGKHSKIKAGWAKSVADPVEEEMHNIKSVYVEQLPSSWNEKEVRDHFKMFGEIESIALAKNLWSTKRNDFAFVNYKTCKAALSCIETLSCKKSTGYSDPQAHLKVSLAKSVPKGKSIKTIPESVVTQSTKVSQKANQSRPSQSGYQKLSQSRPSQSGYQTASQSNPSWSGYQKT